MPQKLQSKTSLQSTIRLKHMITVTQEQFYQSLKKKNQHNCEQKTTSCCKANLFQTKSFTGVKALQTRDTSFHVPKPCCFFVCVHVRVCVSVCLFFFTSVFFCQPFLPHLFLELQSSLSFRSPCAGCSPGPRVKNVHESYSQQKA